MAQLAVSHTVLCHSAQAYRRSTGTAVVCGRKLVRDVCRHASPVTVLTHHEKDAQWALERDPGCAVHRASSAVLRKVCGVESVDGAGTVAAEVPIPRAAQWLARAEWQRACPAGGRARVLVLDAVSDPGNVGTLVRTAAALGECLALGGLTAGQYAHS